MRALLRSLQFLAVAAALTLLVPASSRGEDTALPIAAGPYQASWESLESQYQCPQWFRDAKLGIWAHWTAQCVPEQGDWYARSMYIQYNKGKDGKERWNAQYQYQVEHYGHPSKFGFKDIDNLWKAEKWEPEKLIALYKRAGAKYFVALANHHDNFDCFNSKYQPWNSVNIGPKKDIVGGWAKAARAAGLRFGVTVHASHAWNWFEVAQGSDVDGPLKGISYDGKLTKADGRGQWWEGFDPQDLYAQNHKPGKQFVWNWEMDKGSSRPDAAYCQKFFNRTKDLIDSYQPDLLYFDDVVLPLGFRPEIGLSIAAHLYNSSVQRSGKNEAVMNTKGLDEQQRKALVWDIERGVADRVEPFVWQTDTCIGSWHYRRETYEKHAYKTVHTVIAMLADIVSKNGNLLLNVPVRGDGTIDDQELAVVEGLAQWMPINGEAIYGTRPWKIYGEGAKTQKGSNFNEGKVKYTANDVRFTTKDGALYAICLDVPTDAVSIRALGQAAGLLDKPISSISLLGSDAKIAWKQQSDALVIQPAAKWPCENAVVFKISFGPGK